MCTLAVKPHNHRSSYHHSASDNPRAFYHDILDSIGLQR